ncbi:MAG: hypothetical protein NVV72_03350 [Asticcacaulis sp.]|nr:hypothetical protein [Asticcacaulis sp.]
MSVVKAAYAVLALISVLAGAGGSQAAVPEPKSKMLLSDYSVDAACRQENFDINRQTYSPDRLDQDRFYEQRYNRTNNTIKFPLPVLCIYRAYGSEALKAWAEKSDVVAKYVLFQVNYKRDCSALKSDAAFLYSVARIRFKNRHGVVISRLPEAYELLANMQLMCGMLDASDESSALAYKAGYQSHMTFLE